MIFCFEVHFYAFKLKLFKFLFNRRSNLKRFILSISVIFFAFNVFSKDINFAKMKEQDKIFCMLSCNSIELNDASNEELNPAKNNQETALKILAENYEIYTYFNLQDRIDSILNNKTNNYTAFYKLQTEKAAETIMDSAIQNGICFDNLCQYLYIPLINEKLGSTQIMAWNYGNALEILRWSIGAELITEEEAKELAAPFINSILNSFASYEDYLCHYILGAGFDSCKNYNDLSETTDQKYKAFISFIDKNQNYFPKKMFKGKLFIKKHKNQILDFENTLASIKEESIQNSDYFVIEKIYQFFIKNYLAVSADSLTNQEIEYNFLPVAETPYYFEVLGFLKLHQNRISECFALFKENEQLFGNIPNDSLLYNNFYSLFALAAFTNNDFYETLNISNNISEDYADINEIYHIMALSYIYLFMQEDADGNTQLADEYLSKSIDYFINAVKKGYRLSTKENEFILKYTNMQIEELIFSSFEFQKV